MERRALVLALALTLPLVLYGVPYAYAAGSSSSYVVFDGSHAGNPAFVHCKTGDYATGGGGAIFPGHLQISEPAFFDGASYSVITTGQPNAWSAFADQPPEVYVVCQAPIPLPAGLGVPEFGSLYVAIALGALVYFMMSRRFAGRPTLSAEVKA